MAKRSKRKERSHGSAASPPDPGDDPSGAEERGAALPSSSTRVPRRNKPLLATSITLLVVWLAILTWLAVTA